MAEDCNLQSSGGNAEECKLPKGTGMAANMPVSAAEEAEIDRLAAADSEPAACPHGDHPLLCRRCESELGFEEIES